MIKFLIAIACTLFVAVNSENAPFQHCSARPSISRDIRVDVSPCNMTLTNETCSLVRGSQTNFTIYFTPEANITGPIERYIIAKFVKKMRGKHVEVPYGSAVPADDRTFPDDGSLVSIGGKGLVAGKPYFFNNLFSVLTSSPKTTLWVRYLIRETLPCKKSKCSYLLHSGRVLACIEIPVTLD